MRAIRRCSLVIVCLVYLGIQRGDTFLNCPLLTPPQDTLDRRCCQSVHLPNGCECFDVSITSSFNNLRRPHCPENLGVMFFLYTRESPVVPVKITSSEQKLRSSGFVASRPTQIIIHGWTGHAPAIWSEHMKDELLKVGESNVILVNWKKGASRVYYQSVANLRTIGAMIANLIVQMAHLHGGKVENFHLIGHSLGAHMSGFAGKEVYRLTSKKVARITGLDPAGLAFEGHPANVRLDKSDAHFVDVIHTDAEPVLTSGYGIRSSVGHVDFFPNGGIHQPGCPVEVFQFLYLLDFQGPDSVGVCSHIRVVKYFTNSINKCRYDPPTEDTACTMGYHVSPDCQGKFFPSTTDKEPFC